MADTGEGARAALASILDVSPTLARSETLLREILDRVSRLEERLPRDLVSPKEAERRLGASRSTVARKIRDGSLPTVRLSARRVLVDMTSIRPVQPEEIGKLAREARSSR